MVGTLQGVGSRFRYGAWMDQMVTGKDRGGRDITTERWRRLCFLITANGDFTIGKPVGAKRSRDDGHQKGLTIAQTVELAQYAGILAGLELAGQSRFVLYLGDYMTQYERDWALTKRYNITAKDVAHAREAQDRRFTSLPLAQGFQSGTGHRPDERRDYPARDH